MSAPDLRLIVITDRALAAPRSIEDVVRDCLEAGAPAIQLRDKLATAAELLGQAQGLRELTAAHGALLFLNDRLDVARAAGADGVHFGPDDLPVRAARAVVPSDFLIGYSTDNPELARASELDGATYIGCGAVYGTASKAGLAAEKIGAAGLRNVVRAVRIPVIAIGGITPENIDEVAAAGAAGCAAISTIMSAPAPGQIVRRLLDAFTSP